MATGSIAARSPVAPGADAGTVGSVAPGGVAVPDGVSSYPGGKSGAGIYQRLINLIPRHRILITAFAGQCGVTRNIRPAEHTIVIDADEKVCQWWDNWRRSPAGRALEIHHCDSIEWLRFRFGLTEYNPSRFGEPCNEYSAAGSSDALGRDQYCDAVPCGCRGRREDRRPVMAIDAEKRDGRPSHQHAAVASVADSGGTAATLNGAAEAFVFCDPPYVLSQRAHGKQYACELTDDDHRRLLQILTAIPATRARVMLCGYASEIYATTFDGAAFYASGDPWRSIDHRVPTRGGLQDERIWMNYDRPERLHDHRYVGRCRRSRERIRRRQKNWLSQLTAMSDRERAAMLEILKGNC